MTAKEKRAYLKLCMEQDVWWLKGSLENLTPYMRPIHVLLIRLAIRKKGGE